jgi:hypothetical protein
MEPMQCPECRRKAAIREIQTPYFSCSGCATKVTVSKRYILAAKLLSTAIAFGICYAAGLSGAIFLICWGPAIFPVYFIVLGLGFKTVPPYLERYSQDGSLGLDNG